MICLLAKCLFIVIRETWLMASHVFWTEPFDSIQQHCLETCDPCGSACSLTSDSRTSLIDVCCNSVTSVGQQRQDNCQQVSQTNHKKSKSCETRVQKVSSCTSTTSLCRQTKSAETNTRRSKKLNGSTQTSIFEKSRKTNTPTDSKSKASVTSQIERNVVDDATQSKKISVGHSSTQHSVNKHESTTETIPVITEPKESLTDAPVAHSSDSYCQADEITSPRIGTTSVGSAFVGSPVQEQMVVNEDIFLQHVASELGKENHKNKKNKSEDTFKTASGSLHEFEDETIKQKQMVGNLQGDEEDLKKISESYSQTKWEKNDSPQQNENNWFSGSEFTERYNLSLWTVIYILVFLFLLLHLAFIAYHHRTMQNIRDNFKTDDSSRKNSPPQELKQGTGESHSTECCKRKNPSCSQCPRRSPNPNTQEYSPSYIIA